MNVLDLMDDSIQFKPGHCSHWGSPRVESEARRKDRGPIPVVELYDPSRKPKRSRKSKTTYLPPVESPTPTSPAPIPKKYEILQRRDVAHVRSFNPPKPTVEDALDEDDEPRTDSLGSDFLWSLIGTDENSSLESALRAGPGGRRSTAARKAARIRIKKKETKSR